MARPGLTYCLSGWLAFLVSSYSYGSGLVTSIPAAKLSLTSETGWTLIGYDLTCYPLKRCWPNLIGVLAFDYNGSLYWGDNIGTIWQMESSALLQRLDQASRGHNRQEIAVPHTIYQNSSRDAIVGITADAENILYFTTVARLIGGSLWGYSVTASTLVNGGDSLYTWHWYAPWALATGVDGQSVYVTDNSGEVLVKPASSYTFSAAYFLPFEVAASALVIDRNSGLYLVLGGGLYYVSWQRSSWQPLESPQAQINALTSDPEGHVYAGWQNGTVSKYLDGRKEESFRAKLPYPVQALAFNSSAQRLIAGTGIASYNSSRLRDPDPCDGSSSGEVWLFDAETGWISTNLAALDANCVFSLASYANYIVAALRDGSVYGLQF